MLYSYFSFRLTLHSSSVFLNMVHLHRSVFEPQEYLRKFRLRIRVSEGEQSCPLGSLNFQRNHRGLLKKYLLILREYRIPLTLPEDLQFGRAL